MKNRILSAALTAVVAALLVPVAISAQQRVAKAPTKYEQPKTAWGHPDLQGIWNNVTGTPLQRPDNFKDKSSLTQEEAADFERQATERALQSDATPSQQQSVGARTGYSPVVWFETSRALVDNRTSLITSPENGRFPELTPEAKKIQEAFQAAAKTSPADKPEDRGPYERCITRGLPGSMMPGFYNHNYHIMQTPTHIAIQVEMIHDARIIPLDGRPHVNSSIKQWLGDSRGRWEGNTLVVETTNLRPMEQRNVAVFGTTDTGKVIERFTRLGPDVMDYQITVEDPKWYTQTWTASIPMSKVPGPLYEYACHEGNYGLPNILAGHRQEERQAAEKK
jgi:hypothetical protein